MESNSEQREFYRYELNIPVWLEVENERGEPHREKCHIINLSQKGIQFESKLHHDIGKTLGVRFFLPRFGAPVRGVVKVIWIKDIIPDRLFRIGCEFVELENVNQEQLKEISMNLVKDNAPASVCPSCGCIDEQITLNEEELHLIKMLKNLNQENKKKAVDYLTSLSDKSAK